MFAFINGVQPLCGNFFTSIGKAFKGIFISTTRQFVFFLPLVFLLPTVFGLDGIVYSGPAADFAAVTLAAVFVWRETARMKRHE